MVNGKEINTAITTTQSSNSSSSTENNKNDNDDDVDVEIESLTISNDSVVQHDDKTQKLHTRIQVQHDGGFQNDFIFAERLPISSTKVWYELNKYKVEVEAEAEVYG
jgi:hypothetical protein